MIIWWGQNNANSLKITLTDYKLYKFTKRSGIISKCPEYHLVHMNTHYIRKPDHFS